MTLSKLATTIVAWPPYFWAGRASPRRTALFFQCVPTSRLCTRHPSATQ